MHPNTGSADRILRAIIGPALIAGTFMPSLLLAGASVLQALVVIASLVLRTAALLRLSPIHRLIGVST